MIDYPYTELDVTKSAAQQHTNNNNQYNLQSYHHHINEHIQLEHAQSSESYCSATMGSKIFLSICPLILIFGTFTNIFSLLVLSRKRMRKHSTYVYLAILSVIDLLALWLGLMRDYLAHGYGIYIKSLWLCKLHSFMFYYTLDLSSWILVAVSLDRFFAISYVFSSYTRQLVLKILAKPKMIFSIICSFFLVLNFHFVFYVEADLSNSDFNLNGNRLHKSNDNKLIDRLSWSMIWHNSSKNISLKSHHRLSQILSEHHHLKSDDKDQVTEHLPCSISILASESKSLIVMPYELSYQDSLSSSNQRHSIGVAGEYLHCVIDKIKNPYYLKFFINVWPYIDLSAYAILPFCVMFICNIAIIKNAKFSTPSSISNSQTNIRNNHIGLKRHSTSSIKLKRNFIASNNTSTTNNLNKIDELQAYTESNPNLHQSNELVNDTKQTKFINRAKAICCCCVCEPNENAETIHDVQILNDFDCCASSNKVASKNVKVVLNKSSSSLSSASVRTECSNNIINTPRSSNQNRNSITRNSFSAITSNNLTNKYIYHGNGGSNKQMPMVFSSTPTASSINSANFHARNIKMMTLTIISITCIFILLTLPIMLFIVVDKFTSDGFATARKSLKNNSSTSAHTKSNESIVYTFAHWFLNMDPNCKSILWAIVNIFMYINHSINFVLYCLTGSKFRTELATLFVSKQALINTANNEQSQFSMMFRNFSTVKHARPPPNSINYNYKPMRSQSIFANSGKL